MIHNFLPTMGRGHVPMSAVKVLRHCSTTLQSIQVNIHADDGRAFVFVCLFVCLFSTWYLKNRCSYDQQTWHRHCPPWVLETNLFFESKGQKFKEVTTLLAWVMMLLWVLASSSCHGNLAVGCPSLIHIGVVNEERHEPSVPAFQAPWQ